jgi:integrase/recombinase XerD
MGRTRWAPTVSGPLAPYAAAYRRWLVDRGFCAGAHAVACRVWQLDHLSRWLEREGLAVDRLTSEEIARFVAARRAVGYRTWVSPLSLRLPLAFLREAGVAPPSTRSAAEGSLERLLEDYRRYLAHERGLASTTIEYRLRHARVFLEDRERAGGLRLERLTAAEVTGFLARECPKRNVAGARRLVECLRPLLRYLHVTGLISTPLRWAVPGVADLRDRSLPRGVEPVVVKRLLASCDRRRTVGRRDYAVLLLLARLGLRAGEVAALTLDDIDWRRGEIVVRGKGGRLDRLPLPVDVGDALVSYLRRRPSVSGSRALFLKVLAPAGPLASHSVQAVVREACRRAGLESVGPHRLRHTAATEMLRHGASLPEIGQVLRHRDTRTTARYAKVDRARLRALALPWPEGAA